MSEAIDLNSAKQPIRSNEALLDADGLIDAEDLFNAETLSARSIGSAVAEKVHVAGDKDPDARSHLREAARKALKVMAQFAAYELKKNKWTKAGEVMMWIVDLAASYIADKYTPIPKAGDIYMDTLGARGRDKLRLRARRYLESLDAEERQAEMRSKLGVTLDDDEENAEVVDELQVMRIVREARSVGSIWRLADAMGIHAAPTADTARHNYTPKQWMHIAPHAEQDERYPPEGVRVCFCSFCDYREAPTLRMDDFSFECVNEECARSGDIVDFLQESVGKEGMTRMEAAQWVINFTVKQRKAAMDRFLPSADEELELDETYLSQLDTFERDLDSYVGPAPTIHDLVEFRKSRSSSKAKTDETPARKPRL